MNNKPLFHKDMVINSASFAIPHAKQRIIAGLLSRPSDPYLEPSSENGDTKLKE